MGVQRNRINHRVVVYPLPPGDHGYFRIGGGEPRTADQEYAICDEIRRQIELHVPKYEFDRGHVRVEWETEDVCEHCGYTWAEGIDSPHNGGCCDKDCEVCEAEEAARAATEKE